jgi:hypothetical protein
MMFGVMELLLLILPDFRESLRCASILIVAVDVDDFIVDEEGKSISEGKKKRRIIHDDAYGIFR